MFKLNTTIMATKRTKIDKVHLLKDSFRNPTRMEKELGLEFGFGRRIAEDNSRKALRMQKYRNKMARAKALEQLADHEERKKQMIHNYKNKKLI